jgi:inhibitor of KinA
MNKLPAYKIIPLGDAALSVDFGNIVNHKINDTVISIFKKLQQYPVEGMTEAVPAYSSLTIYYDVMDIHKKGFQEKTVFDFMKSKINTLLEKEIEDYQNEKKLITIPVCYEKEFATDMEWITEKLKLSKEEFIQIHISKSYRVYMLGFLPGFAYMGEVDAAIELPRKQQPMNVVAGSVGIAGKQTGVYPLSSPGGWQIIGRTPLNFFNKKNNEPALVQAGDNIKFISISKDEFESIKSRNS